MAGFASTSERRPITIALVAVPALAFGYATLYWWGMAAFENRSISYLHALQVVVETMTTTGYGGDAPFRSTAVEVLLVVVQLTGHLLVLVGTALLVTVLVRRVRSGQSA